MVIKEKKTYVCKLDDRDVESLSDTINLLYQFKNNPEAWKELQDADVNSRLKSTCLNDMIDALTEIGGEAYQKYIRRVQLSSTRPATRNSAVVGE